MKQIRRSVFETNSSSMHSLTVKGDFNYDNSLSAFIGYDNYLHITFGQFGWEWEEYNDAYTKLQYLLTFIAEKFPYEELNIWCCEEPLDMDEIYDKFKTRDDFNELNDLIKSELHCNGIWLDEGEGYIDHQSHEDYASIKDLLNHYGISSMKDFIFDSNVTLRTGNDNEPYGYDGRWGY